MRVADRLLGTGTTITHGFEAMEPRQMLAGVTLITHGFQATGNIPSWVDAMRDAIEARAGTPGLDSFAFGMFHSDVSADDIVVSNPSPGSTVFGTQSAEMVGFLDWADASNSFLDPLEDTFTATSVAIKLFDAITVAWEAIGIDEAPVEMPIHLIGHSRGAAVMSELARQLGEVGIWVDQITLLDAHPLTTADVGVDVSEIDAGMRLWSNALFSDAYYEFEDLITVGEPVETAWNTNLSILPGMDHSGVHQFYHGTVDVTNAFPDGGPVDDAWYGTAVTGLRDEAGFRFSRLAGGDRTAATVREGLLAAFGGDAVRDDPVMLGGQWPNVADLRLVGGNALRRGQYVQAEYRFGDRDSDATVQFFLDTDENPYNAGSIAVGSKVMTQSAYSDGTAVLDMGSAGPGSYRVYARVTDGERTRYSYLPDPVTIAANAVIGTTRLYFPEGFRSGTINEYVPIVNSNNFAVEFQVIARYEAGERDQVLYTGTILPGRDGITVTEVNNQSGALVREGTGYSLELRASAPLGATMSHYDFGVAAGEAFDSATSTSWYFANVKKESASVRDFITWFNPSGTDGLVTITVYQPDGTTVSQTWSLFALRRGGMTVDGEPWIPQGNLGVLITTTLPVVASISHYEIQTGQGFIAMGESSAVSADGLLPFTDLNAASSFRALLFNPGAQDATVEIGSRYESGSQLDTSTTVVVPAGRTLELDDVALGLVDGQRGVVWYSSSHPIIVGGSVNDNARGDGLGIPAATRTARTWLFADGFMPAATAGTQYIEYLTLLNPGLTSINITVTHYYFGGETDASVRTLAPGRSITIPLHLDAEILEWGSRNGGANWFSIGVASNAMFAASMIHWDLTLQGGWQTLGTPIGTVALI